MKNTALFILLTLTLTACEDVIDLDTETGPAQLVVDGWITNQTGPQSIRLSQTAGYFDNSPAKPVLGATVLVTDEAGTKYEFKDLKSSGQYVWTPFSPTNPMGYLGGDYTLSIKTNGEEYQAKTHLYPVPRIDSLTYFFEKPPIVANDSPKEGYQAEFFARDLPGEGNCYWIKVFKNGKYFAKTTDINLAYDAAFSPGAASDGLLFILPIRRSITPELWQERDTVRVELHAIPKEAFFFLQQVRLESSNQGLFATPPSNIISNVVNQNSGGRKALGFFGGSIVSGFQTVIDPKKARPKP
ncbi:MAG: DUF4249 domain-containing protein [Cytophagaceae bacterium]|nr:DUF4249 domain-containing protein [Cytophagaceae bacterium]